MEKNLGHATAYGYAKSKGYSGTEEEFAELMADYASVGQSAAQSAEQAAASATSASGSATTATQAAQTATSKASEAVTAADTATTKASEASTSADTASAAATSASTSAQTATTAASTATTKASKASESAATATAAKTDAETARDAAAQSASEAAASAESIDPDEFDRKIYAAFATDTASGAVANFPDGADSIPMKDVLVHIEPVQAGSGDPSPDNIRPITGWTGVKVTRCGKNLFYSGVDITNTLNGVTGTFDAKTQTISIVGTNTHSSPYILLNLECAGDIPREVALARALFNVPSGVYPNLVYKKNGVWFSVGNGGSVPSEIDTDTSVTLQIGIYGTATTINATDIKGQIELGSTATAYEPYSGQTYDITFPTEAGTVYGGTLDVTKGELVVDRAMVDLGTLNWNALSGTEMRARTPEYTRDSGWSDSYARIASNALTVEDPDMVFNNRKTYDFTNKPQNYYNFDCKVPEGVFADANAFKTWLNDIDGNGTHAVIVIPMATSITYALTQQEITSLLGTNNLWADTGNSEVEYRADAKLYITKKITEAVSALF